MEANWVLHLKEMVYVNFSLQDVSDFLKKLRDQGIEKETVRLYLNDLNNIEANNEIISDRILEVLDIVEGFCNVRYRVW